MLCNTKASHCCLVHDNGSLLHIETPPEKSQNLSKDVDGDIADPNAGKHVRWPSH